MGPRSDFDLLRILSHQLEKLGLAKHFTTRRRPRCSKRFAKRCRRMTFNRRVADRRRGADARAICEERTCAVRRSGGLIRSAEDTLFTSGTLAASAR